MLTIYKSAYHEYALDANNRFQGDYISYHVNGRIYIRAFFVNDKFDGKYVKYDESGLIDMHIYYKMATSMANIRHTMITASYSVRPSSTKEKISM